MEFLDFFGNRVKLTFDKKPFQEQAGHVLVLPRYMGKWVMTKHKVRGLEFPGGKREQGETPEMAAEREVLEETGGIVGPLYFIGQYEVSSNQGNFVKNIYFTEINGFTNNESYFETNGPTFIDSPLTPEELGDEYSFIMKDEVIQRTLHYLKEHGFI